MSDRIRLPNRGKGFITPREHETLRLLAQGLSAPEIADAMQVSRHYVYHIIRLLKARFNVRSMGGIVWQATQEGFLQRDEGSWQEDE